jgi:hypothetical protein
MKQYIFTQAERADSRKQIIKLIGVDAYRKMVARAWQLRRTERKS